MIFSRFIPDVAAAELLRHCRDNLLLRFSSPIREQMEVFGWDRPTLIQPPVNPRVRHVSPHLGFFPAFGAVFHLSTTC